MSVKHVKDYYNTICDQYKEMVENIKDIEAEVLDGIVEPERVDRLREQIAPIKQNYERWTYMMFLLNKPQKASKVKKYKKQNERLLSILDKSNSLEGVVQENHDAMKHIGD